jgi:two-component system, cell cycle sensor histidine kinase and response regulator CckA
MARAEPPEDEASWPSPLRNLLDAVDHFAAAVDADGRLLFLNCSGRRLLGLPSDSALLHQPLSSWIAPDSVREQTEVAIPRALDEGSWVGDSILRGANGSDVPVVMTLIRQPGEHDGPPILATLCRTRSSTTDTEAALRESEARHQSIFDHSLDAVFLTSPDGEIISANAAAARMMGYRDGEMTGLGRRDILDMTDPRLPQAIEERQRTGRFRGELTLKRADGSRFPGEISSAVFEDAQGMARTSLIIRDVTRRNAAEEALHQSETSFRNLFDSITESVCIQHRDGTILDVNPAFLSMYGYCREEIVGKLPEMLLDPDRADFRGAATSFDRALSGQPQRFELWGRRRCGECFPQEVALTRGTYFGEDVVISVAREVSEQKNLEQQLRQSQKMEAIGRLAGGVAHDFNNILTVIRGNAEILQAELAGDDARLADVVEIATATRRAAELTHQLLAFSRRQVLLPKVLDLNAVLFDMEKMLRRVIGEDIELRVTLDPDLGMTLADPGQVQQVVMNLVINARDAMPRGGRISLETRNCELDFLALRDGRYPSYVVPGSYVAVEVGDTGSGIDRATLNRLFEPFFTTKEPGKGTGLGLSTVYGIIKQSNGFVWAESEAEEGSTFTVLLPQVESDEPYEFEAEPTTGTPTETGAETILLVEDEAPVRTLVRRVLERAGYRVLEAADGEEAFGICARFEGAIDLVLTDVIMPGISGPDVAAGAELLRPEARILYMSGYTDDALSEHGVAGGELRLLQKPFSSDVLLARVRKVLTDQE